MMLTRLPRASALGAIEAYRRFVSPLLARRCRFEPSCSAYAAGAISEHGVAAGTYLACRRLLRCHPFHAGGFDPVPDRRKEPGCSTQ